MFLAAIVLQLIFLVSCKKEDTVKVGFLGPLTGSAVSLGLTGRDGAILAVEEFNAKGGINGQIIELIIRDDKFNGDMCKKVITEFANKKVSAVIGPMTSSMGILAAPLINFHRIPTISPTVATNELAMQDDFFFRIMPVSQKAAERSAEYLFYNKNYNNIHVIYDTRNRAFTESWYSSFRKHFLSIGGQEIGGLGFVSKENFDYLALAREVDVEYVDCLLIVASAMDTALLSQQLAKLGKKVSIFTSEWAATNALVEYGGLAVEGLEFVHPFDRNDRSSEYLDFVDAFTRRFGYEPSFASAYSYNAAQILFQVLAKGGDPDEIKRNLIALSPYSGVQGQIEFDKYGDVQYDYSLFRVENRRIITVKTDA